MKILIVGNWSSLQYERAFSESLSSLGVTVQRLVVLDYFTDWTIKIHSFLPLPTIQMIKLNRAIIKKVKEEVPDLVFFWRPVAIFPKTLKKLKNFGVLTVSYNNDDPFNGTIKGKFNWKQYFLWFWYLKSLPHFHENFFFRKINCDEANSLGINSANLLLPYFLPWRDKPIERKDLNGEKFVTQVVFVGHFEPDGREQYLSKVIEHGFDLKIWGDYRNWSSSFLHLLYRHSSKIVPALGDDYAKALNGADICLCFLSKLNRDTYTYRCFEIPACGKVLLSERTDDLTRFFKEDEEACFFSNEQEMIRKIKWLIENPDLREQIATAGMKRVWRDGHDVFSRSKEFLEKLKRQHRI